MKLFVASISPLSSFATKLKGDTLFGQLCWAIRYKFGNARLEELLSSYETSPFLVVSDGFATGFLPKPKLPSSLLGEDVEEKKENRKRVWLTLDELQNGEFDKARKDEEIGFVDKGVATIKNSINYQTFTTDSENFAPYSVRESFIDKRDLYFLIDESRFSKDELSSALQAVAHMGYGKKASIGKGSFEFDELRVVEAKSFETKSFMTLSPAVIADQGFVKAFYEPFTRFGKHGGELSGKNPFKKPLLLADSCAVLISRELAKKSFVGKAIRGHSSDGKTVHQGYSIAIAIKDIEI